MLRFFSLLFILCILLKPQAHTQAAPAYCHYLHNLKAAKVRVAILDTGLDVDHTELKDFIWKNPGETGLDPRGHDRAQNGIDDDHNGYIDDVSGWNFINKTNNVEDQIGHGTHVAGLVLGDLKNKNKNVELMPLKYYGGHSKRMLTHLYFAQALQYAIDNGAHIIQISGGGYSPEKTEMKLLKRAEELGILIVAASGNKKSGEVSRPFFPASYPLTNIFTVSAVDQASKLLRTSNICPSLNFFTEQGEKVVSTLPKNRFGARTGTSQAAGLFTGKLLAKMGKTTSVAANCY